jgi:ABC-type transport system involved in cytochrome c biogenesis permease subunit
VSIALHQLTAACYLVAGLVGALGLALPAPRLGRAAVAILGAGALAHAFAFATLHTAEPTPQLTDFPAAVSLMAFLAIAFFLVLLRVARVAGLVVLVGPVAFLGVFYAALALPSLASVPVAAGGVPHAHVVLASAGFAFFGVSALAGGAFLIEHRRLKAKRPFGASRAGERSGAALRLPSLEALDRVNAAALVLGFPLLTLGIVTGMLWLLREAGRPWTGSAHEIWSVAGWSIYCAVAIARFGARRRGRSAALLSVVAFGFLLFAVVGVELVS